LLACRLASLSCLVPVSNCTTQHFSAHFQSDSTVSTDTEKLVLSGLCLLQPSGYQPPLRISVATVALLAWTLASLSCLVPVSKCTTQHSRAHFQSDCTVSSDTEKVVLSGLCLLQPSGCHSPLRNSFPTVALLACRLASLSCLVPVSNCTKQHFQLTFRIVVLSALILSSYYYLRSADYRHLMFNALCASALPAAACSPADWQACPAWCLYRSALHSTFSSLSE